MLIDYIEKKLKSAHYKILEDKTFFGEIPDLAGVWANAKNLGECREELREVLEDWLLILTRKNGENLGDGQGKKKHQFFVPCLSLKPR